MRHTQGPKEVAALVMAPNADGDALSSAAPQERKRPLRTYGKRSAPVREPEAPLPKRQRVAAVKEEKPTREEPLPQLPQLPKQGPPPKRDSILSYFKRLPSSSSIPAVPSSDPAEPALTPPPSSPVLHSRARPRTRLTTRTTIIEEDDLDSRDGEGVEKEEHWGSDLEDGQHDRPSLTSHTNHERNPLSETAPSKLNKLESVTIPGKDVSGSVKKKKKIGKRPAKEMVQTTLNLSLNPDSGFKICKECGILYNPLNEKDRKEHKKQHAAYVRNKAKAVVVAASP
ncbi:hypothetical protein B0T16DRAFT_409908 [Cercophora newfieldiana]|uniref:N-acetyltransferase ESCO zinc-finger domain-containing protein n=1 Tax=Cercophora newfieldiana TaxID=92897 RepID=A0AA40CUE0_9PEZI|nr:hypothetical protein B0T16DRAFT_409908 [Cercophora newfieldiana]